MNSDKSNSKENLDLSDVMDLSVIELYLLNYLIKIAGSVIRFTVFNEINEQLGNEKTLSRSSFYNSLQNLEEKGFVEIDTTGGGRKSSVRALPKAKSAIRQVNIFNIWGSVDPDAKFKELIEKNYAIFSARNPSTDKQLIMSFQYPANKEIIDLVSEQFPEVKLLGDESTIGPISEYYDLVNVDERGIVERNDNFAQIIVYRYAYNELQFDFTFDFFVKEVLRVLAPGGNIIFFALQDLRTTNNLILESGIGTVLEETLEKQSVDSLKSILNSINPKPDFWDEKVYNGLSMIRVQK